MSEKYVTLNLLSNGTESESVQVDDESGFLEIQTPPKGRGVLLVVLIPGPGTVESSPQLHMLVNKCTCSAYCGVVVCTRKYAGSHPAAYPNLDALYFL